MGCGCEKVAMAPVVDVSNEVLSDSSNDSVDMDIAVDVGDYGIDYHGNSTSAAIEDHIEYTSNDASNDIQENLSSKPMDIVDVPGTASSRLLSLKRHILTAYAYSREVSSNHGGISALDNIISNLLIARDESLSYRGTNLSMLIESGIDDAEKGLIPFFDIMIRETNNLISRHGDYREGGETNHAAVHIVSDYDGHGDIEKFVKLHLNDTGYASTNDADDSSNDGGG